jgi:hypothetical protein
MGTTTLTRYISSHKHNASNCSTEQQRLQDQISASGPITHVSRMDAFIEQCFVMVDRLMGEPQLLNNQSDGVGIPYLGEDNQ